MSLGGAYTTQFVIQSEQSERRNLYPYVNALSTFCVSKAFGVAISILLKPSLCKGRGTTTGGES